MMSRLKYGSLVFLLAGLLWGSAAHAQGIEQSERVSYALTLVEETPADPAANTPATYRVQVIVSIPRREGVHRYGTVPGYAKPAGLLFRAHGADTTAWAHSIALKRAAPFQADGTTPETTAFYPMPQVSETPNQRAVTNNSATNVDGVAYSTYIREGRAHDPARWESTYLSTKAYAAGESPLVDSLLNGEATHEWYAAGEYGLGAFARVSPIQDLGRDMSFRDLRLWEGSTLAGGVTIESSASALLGTYNRYTLRAMPGASTWELRNTVIGVNFNAMPGAQLLNAAGSDADWETTGAVIFSPLYPDGIASISFTAQSSATGGEAQSIGLYCRSDATQDAWTLLKTFSLSAVATTYTADFTDADGKALAPAGANARFALRRLTTLSGMDSQALSSLVVRDLLVRSAAPSATFGALTVESSDVLAYPYTLPYLTVGGPSVKLSLAATPVAGAGTPKSYAGTLSLRRRARNDASAEWHPVSAEVQMVSQAGGAQGSATLSATLATQRLVTATDGTTNAVEGAFIKDGGEVAGVLPGVYDLKLNYQIYGSFAAGRTTIDQRESTQGEQTSVPVVDDLGQVVGTNPYIVDVRERKTQFRDVRLKVQLKTRDPDDAKAFALTTVEVPCLPASLEDRVWRATVPTTLDPTDYGLPEDEATAYAWGYQADATAAPTFREGYLSFTVEATAADGTVIYGQQETAVAGALPPVTDPVPATTQQLIEATEATAVPVVIEVVEEKSGARIPNSHLLLELDFSAATPSLRVAGAYHQDFNNWFSTGSFAASDFRESVRQATATFDATLNTGSSGDIVVAEGWIPDEGPLAESTAFADDFAVGRLGKEHGLPFTLPSQSNQAQANFRMWGAAPEDAESSCLRDTNWTGGDISRYMSLGNNTEVVLTRGYTEVGGDYLPDAQIRMKAGRGSIIPSTTSGITLNGVGKVSFKLGLSLPYDIDSIAQILPADGPLFPMDRRGVASGIELAEAECANSGFSVSYYLIDRKGNKRYELRLTQLLAYSEDVVASANPPPNRVVAELYQWTADKASRLALYQGTGTTPVAGNALTTPLTSLHNVRVAFWVDSQGALRAGWTSGGITGVPTVSIRSQSTPVAATDALVPAVGSAECRPAFRQIHLASAQEDAFKNDLMPAQADVWVEQSASKIWSLSNDPTSSALIQLKRTVSSSDSAARVSVEAAGSTKGRQLLSTNAIGETRSIILGATTGTLTIQPEGDSSIFIDDLEVSSWCGDDSVRNGNTSVPHNTNEGFFTNNGFAGVGLWVRPVEDEQLEAAPEAYTGRQCVLLQRSRRNISTATSETTTEVNGVAIRHTGNSQAIYSPWSEDGFGTVSFRYRIPRLNEYGSGGENSPVQVMLQYRAASTAKVNWLGREAAPEGEWYTASSPFTLENTNGEWRFASITPKYEDGKTLENFRGNLRLVLVTEGLSDLADPYVYLDDLIFTDNTGTTASWSAVNARPTQDPVALLYWKDRLATSAVQPPEETFAQHSTLTQAMQLNDVTTDSDTEGSFGLASLTSPYLPEGAGRVSFAVRRTTAASAPARVYVEFTTVANEALEAIPESAWKTVTYVDVANTVYRAYDIDLAKFSSTLTPVDANGNPDYTKTHANAEGFTAATVRRLRLRTRLADDQGGQDVFDESPKTGRVLLDQLTVANPFSASLRIRSVLFANQAGGEGTIEGFERQLDRLNRGMSLSPLAQPVSGTSALRVLAALDRLQQVKEGSVNVFFTYNILQPQRSTSGYSYTDTLGNVVEAGDDAPIFHFADSELAAWPALGANGWFGDTAANYLANPTTLPANTIQLTPAGGNLYVGDLAQTALLSLDPNSVVRYMVWATFASEEEEGLQSVPGMATQTAESFTEMPWYFPRSLNAEHRTRYNATLPDDEVVGAAYFTPYYWVYSCLPGEVFVSELNLQDNSGVEDPELAPFAEICAPTQLDLTGWRLETTGSNTTETHREAALVTAAQGLESPDAGVVPAHRQQGTDSRRSFYTVMTRGVRDALHSGADDAPVELPEIVKNAGAVGTVSRLDVNGGTTVAVSVRLLRPTGGAEHIVVYANSREAMAEGSKTKILANINDLHATYQQAYAEGGFGSDWVQEFLETNETWTDTTADGIAAELHGRRLAKADVYPADTTTGNYAVGGVETMIQDYATTARANSLATVDMGGTWVTRTNKVHDDSVTNLSHLVGDWADSFNPAERARANTEDIQVTPRQINPDQFLFRYTGVNQNRVESAIAGMGTHTLELLAESAPGSGTWEVERSRPAGRTPSVTWSVPNTTARVRLTYAPLLFHGFDTVTTAGVTLQIVDAKTDQPVTDATLISNLIVEPTGWTLATDGTGTISFAAPATGPLSVTVNLGYTPAGGEEQRFNLKAASGFVLEPAQAENVLKTVSPFCGEAFAGTARTQPWWGSGFGFEVTYDDSEGSGGAYLSSVLITYPAPEQLNAALDSGLAGDWVGTSATIGSLQGLEYAPAMTLLQGGYTAAGTRFVELAGAREGRVANGSLIPPLKDAYAKAWGYDGTLWTTHFKEPPIPFCAWGVYTVPVTSESGTERVSFLVRQPDARTFTKPRHYSPVIDFSKLKLDMTQRAPEAEMPYFHLYSTPPESAWLNEVNLAQGAGSDDYYEVVMPVLRQGILDNGVPAVEPLGWSLSVYDATGKNIGLDPELTAAESATASGGSYTYLRRPLPVTSAGPIAYVLHRPCGAAEGGVWIGVDTEGGTPVAAPAVTQNQWLVPAAESYVVPGVTDSDTKAGSVQLVGLTTAQGHLSSEVARRTQWAFAAETPLAGNQRPDGTVVHPDNAPLWNQVTMTSTLINDVYGGSPCGYHILGLLPQADSQAGALGVNDVISATLGGPEWVWAQGKDKVFTYRPRSTYRFKSLQMPADLIGKVMLIGKSGGLDEATVASMAADLVAGEAAAADKALYRATRWIQMGDPDINGAVRATVERDAAGNPTGLITFNPDYRQGTGDEDTFGNDSSFTITVLFLEEPPSAANDLVMTFDQGEVRLGAWLRTQTFYALDTAGNPVADKGGVALDKPIWSDETGNEDGDYANQHGWLYQPVAGDTLGMAAVIAPEDGLMGGLIADPYTALTADEPTVRPFLVWTLIPKTKVPTSLFDRGETLQDSTRTEFLDGWSLERWLTNGTPLPTSGDRNAIAFTQIRTWIQRSVGTTESIAAQAGLIPMTYVREEIAQTTAAGAPQPPVSGGLLFRTVTEAELTALTTPPDPTNPNVPPALTTNGNELPFSSTIAMDDPLLWKDGAVLRFAILIVQDGAVVDCQSITNFSSEANSNYCPWYVPDADTNINRVTSAEKKGVSPYFWVYNVGRGDVWLNEFRPFAVGDASPSAVEVAMKAAPVTQVNGEWITDRTLDGWSIRIKAALLPATEDTPLVWYEQDEERTINLTGWIPYRRVQTNVTDNLLKDPNYYELDYYLATTAASKANGFLGDDLEGYPYRTTGIDQTTGTATEATHPNTFRWLNLAEGLIDPALETKVRDTLPEGAVTYGTIYAIQLVRNNGAVEDQVLFRHRTAADSLSDYDEVSRRQAQWALDQEKATGKCANEISLLPVYLPLDNEKLGRASAQYLKQPNGTLTWAVALDNAQLSTLPGPNNIDNNVQPRANYVQQAATTSILSARILGGDGSLALMTGEETLQGRQVSGAFAKNSDYNLTVGGWDKRWYALAGISKNGEDFQPVTPTVQAVYTLSANGTPAVTEEMTVASGTLTQDTDYALAFVYTPSAAALEASGAMNSADAGFLAWLRQVAPEAILQQSSADGVTAAEKYWLGFEAADWDASDVRLTVSEMVLQQEYAETDDAPVVTLPTLTLTLTDGVEPITQLQGDGVVVLLGKAGLDQDWQFLQTVRAEELSGTQRLVLNTDCRFFRAVLLSQKDAQGLSAAPTADATTKE